MDRPVLVRLRFDFRLADNPALSAAVATGRPVLPFYCLDEESPGLRRLGGASRWWLHHSLARLAEDFERCGARLLLLRGRDADVVPDLIRRTGATEIHWNRRYDASGISVDRALKAHLEETGVTVKSHNGSLLYEPWEVTTKAGDPMKVFTPFWRAARAVRPVPMPLPAPSRIAGFALDGLDGLGLADLDLLPTTPDWAGGLREAWTPGETGARARLTKFLESGLAGYAELRNRPDLDNTSGLSPHLRFGEVSPRTVWHAAEQSVRAGAGRASDRDLEILQAELGWREFGYHLLFHNPDLAVANYNRRFDAFPWRCDEPALRAWERGRTGYPIVDAGMRQLWTTGWMHNRVRMIVASFLVKHLLLDWRAGEEWFWDTLTDADPASNPASWQWVAGSGADAAPYFRIFNPVIQGEKFDPEGDYVRRWVPELARLPAKLIHKPWTASPERLAQFGLKLGGAYPRPIVEHEGARDRALAAFQSLKGAA